MPTLTTPDNRSLVERWRADGTLTERVGRMSQAQARDFMFLWEVWSRPNQRIPDGMGDKFRTWFFRAGRGSGKALALDTPIPTPSGWSTMGDLDVGDVVFDENGQQCTVTFATEVQYDRDCFRVVFDDGSEIVADAEHRWLTWDKRARKAHGRASKPTCHPAVRTTSQIRATLTVGPRRERNHSVPVAQPLQLCDADLPIDPYVLGYWLGNGSKDTAVITVHNDDIGHVLAMFAAAGEPANGYRADTRGCSTFGVGRAKNNTDSLTARLRALGVLNNKHVPEVYLRGSESQRRALLAGLMDSDGHCAPNGHVEFCSTDYRLAEAVHELALSLGWRATLNEGRAQLDGRDMGPKWRVIWTPRFSPFTTSRKSVPVRDDRAQRTRTGHRRIVAVEPVPSVPVRCITVDSPSHLYLAGRAMIPTHNTRSAAETVRLMIEQVDRIALVSPTAADVRDVLIEGESGLMRVFPDGQRPVYEPSKRRVTFHNGAKAFAYSGEEPERLRGPQHGFAVIDEPASIAAGPDLLSNLMLGLRLGRAPWVMMTGTPKPVRWLRELSERDDTITTTGSTFDNATFLAPTFIDDVLGRYEGTRLGRQELHAEWLDDVEGALWTEQLIDRNRIARFDLADPWRSLNTWLTENERSKVRPGRAWRVVVAVDPPASTAECGIVVACAPVQARAGEDHCVILEDCSISGTPERWGAQVVSAARRWNAERVVVEANQGGDMVRATIHAVDPGVRVEPVHAKASKQARAEPISALTERGMVHHAGFMPLLESQMVLWVPGLEKSPDRMDAMVHAVTHLLPDRPAQVASVKSPTHRRIPT